MDNKKMTAEEWHDLTWARDQMLQGGKVVFNGQEDVNGEYCFYDKFSEKFYVDFGHNGTEILQEYLVETEWKLYENPKSEPKFVKGQRVLVGDAFNHQLIRRIFSHRKGDLYYCFTKGKDEWTSEGKTFAWKYCKAWEE
ncbi:MAG: hypothetical protein U9N54_07900 [candidate division Zixibacteria bacterium]|nr:hypothetical protein [candidate division Zixibacteria bacterium]